MKYPLIVFLIAYTLGWADTSVPSINELMSIEDQKRTGVIRLTQQQKMELAKWMVEHHYNLSAESDESILYAPTVVLNVSDGKIIELSDNSVWEIAPDDLAISQTWLGSIPVKISSSTNPSYPYLITNLRNQQSVKAKKGQIPN